MSRTLSVPSYSEKLTSRRKRINKLFAQLDSDTWSRRMVFAFVRFFSSANAAISAANRVSAKRLTNAYKMPYVWERAYRRWNDLEKTVLSKPWADPARHYLMFCRTFHVKPHPSEVHYLRRVELGVLVLEETLRKKLSLGQRVKLGVYRSVLGSIARHLRLGPMEQRSALGRDNAGWDDGLSETVAELKNQGLA
jgi:hypothetical protein